MTDEEALIEELARAICDGIGLRSWEDTPSDRGDLRSRIRSGENYDVNEPNRMDYTDAARAILPIIARREQAAEQRIVEWLRKQEVMGALFCCAAAIEAGEHLK